MPYFTDLSNVIRQQFSRLRRTSGAAQDSYGDATFTEQTTTGFRGFFQVGNVPGQTVTIGGKELAYDAIVYTSATMAVGENDVLLFGSSSATTISTRYAVRAVVQHYDGIGVDHKAVYVTQEVVS